MPRQLTAEDSRQSLRACFKTLEPRRVRARGLQEWAAKPAVCRPGALTGRVFKQALSDHVATKGQEIRARYGPHLGWEELTRLLGERRAPVGCGGSAAYTPQKRGQRRERSDCGDGGWQADVSAA